MPEYQLVRKVAAADVQSLTDKPNHGGNGIHAKDGSIFAGYYKNWRSLPQEDRQKIDDECVRKGTKGGKSRGTPDKRKTSALQSDMKAMKANVPPPFTRSSAG